jgi:hypothetical protein
VAVAVASALLAAAGAAAVTTAETFRRFPLGAGLPA